MLLARLTPLVAAALAAALSGCGDKDGAGADGAGGTDGADGTDGTDGADGGGAETVYPSGQRILLYYGHGGYGPEGSGKAAFEAIDAEWKDRYGWNTDHRDTWTADLTDYRFVGLIAPGSGGSASWTAEEVATFTGALEAGTRIAVFGDRSACGSPVVTELLAALGTEMRFTGDAASANSVVQTDDVNGNHQIGADASGGIRMKEPCYIDPTGGNGIVRDNNNHVLVAADPFGDGGEIVLVGDFQFMDDGSGYLDESDTRQFADNLVVVEPGYEPGGDDSGSGRR